MGIQNFNGCLFFLSCLSLTVLFLLFCKKVPEKNEGALFDWLKEVFLSPCHKQLTLRPLPSGAQSQKSALTSPHDSSYLECKHFTWRLDGMKTKQLEDERDAIQEKNCSSYVLGSRTVCVWNWWTAPAGSVPGTTPRFSTASPPARCSGHSETANPSRLAGIDETSASNTKLGSEQYYHAVKTVCTRRNIEQLKWLNTCKQFTVPVLSPA